MLDCEHMWECGTRVNDNTQAVHRETQDFHILATCCTDFKRRATTKNVFLLYIFNYFDIPIIAKIRPKPVDIYGLVT